MTGTWIELVAEFRALRERISETDPEAAKKFRDRWIYDPCTGGEPELVVLRGLIGEAEAWLGSEQCRSA